MIRNLNDIEDEQNKNCVLEDFGEKLIFLSYNYDNKLSPDFPE